LQPYMAEWRERGLDVVLITADRADRMESFVKQHHLELYVLLDQNRKVGRLYRIQGVPAGIYLDQEGNVKHSSIGWGPTSLNETLSVVEHLLREQHSAD